MLSFIDASGRTTLRPGSLPTENLPQKSIAPTTSKPRKSTEVISEKRETNPVLPSIKTKSYTSLEDLNTKISKLKLNQYVVANKANYTKLSKFNNNYSLPAIEIYVRDNLEFDIRVHQWRLHETHDIYNNSLSYITVSSLLDVIDGLQVCEGINNSYSNPNVVPHMVQNNYYPFQPHNLSLDQTVFYRSKKCLILSDSKTCSSCQKCTQVVKKAQDRKLACSSIPAKDKAPLSQTSTERIRIKIASINSVKNDLILENKFLKEQVTALQNSLNDSHQLAMQLRNLLLVMLLVQENSVR